MKAMLMKQNLRTCDGDYALLANLIIMHSLLKIKHVSRLHVYDYICACHHKAEKN